MIRMAVKIAWLDSPRSSPKKPESSFTRATSSAESSPRTGAFSARSRYIRPIP